MINNFKDLKKKITSNEERDICRLIYFGLKIKNQGLNEEENEEYEELSENFEDKYL
jgi:hypothetical protein